MTQRTASLLRILLLLIALYLPCEATFSTRISVTPLALFVFNEGQVDNATTIALDSSHNQLRTSLVITSPSYLWSSRRQGLELTGRSNNGSIGVQSSGIVSPIITSLLVPPSNSFTVEAWLSPFDYVQSGMIMGFGSWDPQVTSTSCIGSGSGSNGRRDWQLAQRGGNVTFILANPGNDPVCSETTLKLNQSVTYHHVIARLSMSSGLMMVALFYNGEYVTSSVFASSSSFNNWASTNTLQISSEKVAGSFNNTWRGVLYLLAMYRYALSQSDVVANFQSDLPNSAPVVNQLMQIVNVTQNTTMNLLPVDLEATDFDSDSLKLVISEIPSRGSLFAVDRSSNWSKLLTLSDLPFYLRLPTTVKLAFTPEAGSWGVGYGRVAFGAYDDSHFSANGLVVIDVKNVIVPPVPINQSTSVYSSDFVLISLNGTDIDPSTPLRSRMSNVFITKLPSRGYLYQYIGSSVPGPVIHSTYGMQLTGPTFSVFYCSREVVNAGSGFTDNFGFGVLTKNTSSTIPGAVTVLVRNSLTTLPANVTLNNDAPRQFSLVGSSASNARLYYLMLSLPAQGQLSSDSGAAVTPCTGLGSPWLSSATKLNTSNLIFTSNVSVNAGRYERSLDPSPVSFWYTVVDDNGNTAAPSLVTITYLPVHHAQVMSSPLTTVTVNRTSFNSNSAYWAVVPSRIIDLDATVGSAFSTVAVSFPPLYTVTASLFPAAGALIRLDPARTIAVQVLRGDSTGFPQVVFSCSYSACNLALTGLQLQAGMAGLYNLTISTSQLDTLVNASLCISVVSLSGPSAGDDSTSDGQGSSTDLAGIFRPSSMWFWVIISGGAVFLVFAVYYISWRRRNNKAARASEITAVAVELAKAVGRSAKSKEAADAEIEAKAHAKAAEITAYQWDVIGQALASPRLSIGVNDECIMPAPNTMMHLPFYGQQSMPTTPRYGALLSPRPFAQPGCSPVLEIPGVQHDQV